MEGAQVTKKKKKTMKKLSASKYKTLQSHEHNIYTDIHTYAPMSLLLIATFTSDGRLFVLLYGIHQYCNDHNSWLWTVTIVKIANWCATVLDYPTSICTLDVALLYVCKNIYIELHLFVWTCNLHKFQFN